MLLGRPSFEDHLDTSFEDRVWVVGYLGLAFDYTFVRDMAVPVPETLGIGSLVSESVEGFPFEV